MPKVTSTSPPLARRLGLLIDAVAGIRDGRRCPGPADQDDDYLYVEVDLPGSAGLEADISVCQGRAVIRLAR